MPILSWITGWVNCAGWVALVATGGLLGSQLVLGAISLMHPVREFPLKQAANVLTSYLHRSQNYTSQPWHQFLIYIGYNLAGFLINTFGNSILPYFNKAACEHPIPVAWIHISQDVYSKRSHPVLTFQCFLSYVVVGWLHHYMHHRSCLRVPQFQLWRVCID